MAERNPWLLMTELLGKFNKELKPEEETLSERTVRWYASEGLLPKPERAGQRALYTQGHLDRLRLIRRLKDQEFRPLNQVKEILSQLNDAQVKAALERSTEPPQRAHAKQLIERLLKDASLRTTHATEPPQTARIAASPPAPHEERWRHIQLADGLMLLVRQPVPRETEALVSKLIAISRSPRDDS